MGKPERTFWPTLYLGGIRQDETHTHRNRGDIGDLGFPAG